jgi:dipeptidyl aminopeptidase/acylaminoacyl peptidase
LKELRGHATCAQALLTVKRASRKKDGYRTTIWVWSDQEHRLLIPSRLEPSSAKQSPDGTRVAFLSKQKNGELQPCLMSLHGGESRPVGEASAEWQSIQQWSRDGSHLLLLRRVSWKEDEFDDPKAGENRPRVTEHLPYKMDGAGIEAGYRVVLEALDVTTGQRDRRVEGDFDVKSASLSPDGKYLAFIRNRAGTQRHRSTKRVPQRS